MKEAEENQTDKIERENEEMVKAVNTIERKLTKNEEAIDKLFKTTIKLE